VADLPAVREQRMRSIPQEETSSVYRLSLPPLTLYKEGMFWLPLFLQGAVSYNNFNARTFYLRSFIVNQSHSAHWHVSNLAHQ
jgi:hypothetical protein